MKKITENELLEKVSKLREYIAVVESEQVNEVNWSALGTGALNAVKNAGSTIANGAQKFFGSTAGKVATGAAAGAGALAAGQAAMQPGQAAAPAGTTAKVPGKSDPAVKALQDKLIAAGAKIKADGIMGPATAAAQKQFPQAAGGTTPAPAPAPAPAALTAADQEDADMGAAMQANAAAAATQAANGVNAQGQNVTVTNADGSTTNPETGITTPAAAPTATAGTAPPAPAPMAGGYGSGAKPAAAPTKAQQLVSAAGLPQPGASAEDMLKNMQGQPGMDPATMMAQQQARMAAMKAKTAGAAPTATAGTPPPAPVGESTSFKNDELSRIVSLVQYR